MSLDPLVTSTSRGPLGKTKRKKQRKSAKIVRDSSADSSESAASTGRKRSGRPPLREAEAWTQEDIKYRMEKFMSAIRAHPAYYLHVRFMIFCSYFLSFNIPFILLISFRSVNKQKS